MPQDVLNSNDSGDLVGRFRANLVGLGEQRSMTFLADGDGPDPSWSYSALDRRARALATHFRQVCSPGDRLLILQPPGLEYVATFLACLYAGIIAVPAYPPPNAGRFARSWPRLSRIVRDCDASAVALPSDLLDNGDDTTLLPDSGALAWLTTDDVPMGLADDWTAAHHTPDDVAFLQYTSGTTNAPRGVRVTHRNLIANLECIRSKLRSNTDCHLVSWLPAYHDMGLIGCILQSMYVGMSATLMAPVSFVRSPMRWLRSISGKSNVIAGGPNFGYELCTRRVGAEDRAQLDLSGWYLAFCGSEPIRSRTMREFAQAFSPAGLRAESLYPCYGLAEATLMVSGGHRGIESAELSVDADDLERGIATARTGAGTRTLVSSGSAVEEHEVRVVDAETGRCCADGTIGEIWVAGPSVADGYWSDRSPDIFDATLWDTSRGGYLRTGDLGFLREGELFVTGRRSELINVGGRNFYPHDLEESVESTHESFRANSCVAFGVDTESGSQLGVLQEVSARICEQERDRLLETIRTTLANEHGVMPAVVVLVEPRTIPKTTSGKVQRSLCRDRYENDELKVVRRWRVDEQGSSGTIRLSAGPDWRRRDELLRYLTDRIREIAYPGTDRSLDPSVGFMDLGLDSVLIVEIRNRLQAELGVQLPTTLLFDYPTVGALATYIEERLPAPSAPAGPGNDTPE